MADEPKRLTDKFALRLPNGMLGQLAKIADGNKRSTNAEIIARLEWSLTGESVRDDSSAPASLSPVGDLEERVRAVISKGIMALSDTDIDYLAGRVASRFEQERDR
ncbi:Arc family DNA-binding protein [Neorhizobium petrolearium]|uniref:Arc family DNA-binding protein n=1 Tax=Neorhizobium petrolearium TaxID=515361 RepID=UPI003F81AA6A